MAKRVIADPGNTNQRGITQEAADWDDAHAADGSSASLGTDSGGNRVTIVRDAGSAYFIGRGVIGYDFRDAGLPGHIRVVRAHLHIGGTSARDDATGGDKLRVGVITNPTISTDISIRKTDYALLRYDSNSYTSAQTVPDGVTVRGAVVQLDNANLLKHLTSAINNRGLLHLGLRNELDILDDASGVTGINRAWFAPPGLQDGSFHVSTRVRLNIFYRVISNLKNTGGRDAGGVASAGFCTGNTFGGTNSGFGS